jgi:hypothetical protein
MQRGRKPASLALLERPAVETQSRMLAPHDLTDEEVEIWRSVVDAFPADWFSGATVPLLTQYCRHAVQARRIAQLIEKATSDPTLKIEDWNNLLRMQKHESDALCALATKMRITQQSIINHRGHNKKALTFKTWETGRREARRSEHRMD